MKRKPTIENGGKKSFGLWWFLNFTDSRLEERDTNRTRLVGNPRIRG